MYLTNCMNIDEFLYLRSSLNSFMLLMREFYNEKKKAQSLNVYRGDIQTRCQWRARVAYEYARRFFDSKSRIDM